MNANLSFLVNKINFKDYEHYEKFKRYLLNEPDACYEQYDAFSLRKKNNNIIVGIIKNANFDIETAIGVNIIFDDFKKIFLYFDAVNVIKNLYANIEYKKVEIKLEINDNIIRKIIYSVDDFYDFIYENLEHLTT